MQLNAYLTLNGQTEEAINFYAKVFNAEIEILQRFNETEMPIEPGMENLIMHGKISFEGNTLMFSDARISAPVSIGNAISMSLNINEVFILEETFKKLSEGGQITMPLQDTFWGARFGMITDKFGIQWMLNCDLN